MALIDRKVSKYATAIIEANTQRHTEQEKTPKRTKLTRTCLKTPQRCGMLW